MPKLVYSEASKKLLQPLRLLKWDRMHVQLDDVGEKFVLDIFSDSGNGQRGQPSQHAWMTFGERLAEKKRLVTAGSAFRWLTPVTDFTVMLIDNAWPREQLVFDDDARLAFNYVKGTIVQNEVNAHTVAKFRERLDTRRDLIDEGWDELSLSLVDQYGYDTEVDQYEVHPEYPLSYYQRVALHNAIRSEGYALFMEQGTGKTPVVIARVCNEAKKKDGLYRAIIVAPNNVRINWQKEFAKFATVPGKCVVLRGGELDRMKSLIESQQVDKEDQYSVVVCSYQAISNSWEALKMIPWDIGVLDESHYIKWPGTARAKQAHKLRDICAKRMILTGTPITNHMLDLYAQFEFLGKGWSGFSSWKNFRSFYGVFKVTEAGHKAITGCTNLPFMQERLARQSFIIRKEEAMPNMPDKVYDVVEVEMSQEQRETYLKVRDHLVAQIESDLDGAGEKKELVIRNVLTKLLRLAQITSGFLKTSDQHDDDGSLLVAGECIGFDPNPKIDAVVELLKEKGPNDKTLIWACWVHDIKAIAARLEEEGIKYVDFYGGTSEAGRERAEYLFNHDPDYKVFIGNPAAGGTGLNLLGYPPGEEDVESNANHVVYFSQNWSPTARSQSEDRAHRRGTREPVRITDLCVPQTIDEEIRNRVLEKRINAYEIADIREILQNVLRSL